MPATLDMDALVPGCSTECLSPQPLLTGFCKPRFFLDIFAGARMPVSTACKRFSVDLFDLWTVFTVGTSWTMRFFTASFAFVRAASWVRHLLPLTAPSTAVPLYVVLVRDQFGRLCIWMVFPTIMSNSNLQCKNLPLYMIVLDTVFRRWPA